LLTHCCAQPTSVYSHAGELLSDTEVECSLPASPVTSTFNLSVHSWYVSVSNDAQRYSAELQLTVYDSSCLDCQCIGQCRLKVSRLYRMTSWRILINPLTRLLSYGYSKHPVPDRVKMTFVIFDIRALWRSGLSIRVHGCKKITNDA